MHINQLDHLRSNPMIRFKQETVHGKELEIVSYMIGDKELWNDPMALETRGNTYDVQTGECVAACFPKFFNVNEREETQQDLIKDQIVEVYEKKDGCLDENSLIETEDGIKTIKEICETNYSKMITGYDEINKCFIQTQIEGVSIKENKETIWYEIELENEVILKLTNNHQVWSESQQCYIRSDHLTIGENIIFKQI